MKKAIFRVDAGSGIGFGHLNRCIILANELVKKKFKVIFILSSSSKFFTSRLNKNGFKYYCIKNFIKNFNQIKDAKLFIDKIKNIKNIDVVFVDNYFIDYRWEKLIKCYTKKIFVIDDLNNRKHLCEYYLNNNLLLQNKKIKNKLDNKNCIILKNKKYMIIKPDYKNYKFVKREKKLKSFFIFFGAEDKKNCSLKILHWLLSEDYNFNFYFIKTPKLENQLNDLKKIKNKRNYKFYPIQKDLLKIFKNCDAMISSGGTINFERIFVKIPGLIFKIADNQKYNCNLIKKFNLGTYKGNFSKLNKNKFLKLFNNFLINYKKNNQFKNFNLDSQGAKRIANLI